MKYGDLDLSNIFDEIWEIWPNKTGEAASKKAFTVACRSGNSADKILLACKSYVFDNAGTDPLFLKQLGNYIRDDSWRDTLEFSDPEKVALSKKKCIDLIKEWNKCCKPHWCKVESTEPKIASAKIALGDKDFLANWRKALDEAFKIFRYEFASTDSRSKIILSFKWFATVGDRHTVMRIIEGEYGKGYKEREVKEVKSQPIDYEKRQEMAAYLKTLNPNINFENKPKPEQPRVGVVHSEQAKAIAEKILNSVGIPSKGEAEGDDGLEFFDSPRDRPKL